MAISKVQPMRPAEIELVDLANGLETGLAQEVSERKAADATLQTDIDAETKTRSDMDKLLQSNIDTEAVTRGNADATLQKAIETEETNRVEGDRTLQDNIETTKTELQTDIETAKTELQTLFEGFTRQFEWGSQDEIEVIANNNTVITVTFTEEKTELPIVLITLQNANGETAVNAYAALRDVSTTEFHVRIYNLDETNNQQLKVNWLAIGE